jgi:hypothetical protein
MTIFGRALDSFGSKIGKAFSYNNMKQFGNKIANGLNQGLKIANTVGDVASNVLGKGADVANGLGFGVIGNGLNMARNIVNIGRKGVQGLEKLTDVGKNVAEVIDKNHISIGNALRSGDTSTLIKHGGEIMNPLKQL